MIDYLWMYILGAISFVTLVYFLMSFSRDVFLMRRLKLSKSNLVINFSLLLLTLSSLILIIYLFVLLKEQIKLLG
ncbi:hypothetical protein UAW_02947 [Enterococcus haemoperoxidus ATCC BAA-382]|uniref:Uncharacterized protein n=1 Tax=Enterococcus haemoperoxidus ATCC BAA-382 TaxID=1158608 RepID=R2SJ65_9ENTE|nr:hypothetical protein [Enterococcus haemoperoxidus]EOH92906.1 hypothetical protein UAW_02947 [Enterococcus haemoperoxidus ATCC BAA-382]EOT61649.1 hypothetical protein I583_00631 [Enterococcus haemoperoxidus ATCC BAA-382]